MTKPSDPSTLRLPTKPAKRAAPTAPTPRARPVAAAPKPAAAAAKPIGDRLSKRVAAMLPCSRTEAEQYIQGGWVRVDGQIIEEPQFRVDRQTVTIDPNASLIDLNTITLLLHKPADWVDGTEESLAKLNRDARRGKVQDARTLLTTANHQRGDAAGIRLLQRHFKNLEAMVPLENAASGLVVFTQDWRVARKLADDMGVTEHEVIVEVAGEVSTQALHRLNRTQDSDPSLPQTKVSINSTTPERTKLRFAIKGAHRGLIAFLCARAQLEILDMRRIRLGRVALSDLPPGQWRYLGVHEKF